jgi:hypothetical protein
MPWKGIDSARIIMFYASPKTNDMKISVIDLIRTGANEYQAYSVTKSFKKTSHCFNVRTQPIAAGCMIKYDKILSRQQVNC